MSRAVAFLGPAGSQITGHLHQPAGTPTACALLAHCFTSTAAAAKHIAESLASRGIAALRIDVADTKSEPAAARSSDLVAHAANYARAHIAPPTIMIGHGQGGVAVVNAVERNPDATAVAVIGMSAEAPNILERVHSLQKACLILHSHMDADVPVDNARRLFEAALHPKSFISLDGADHQLSRPADAAYAGTVIAAWAERFVPESQLARRVERVPEGLVVVHGGPTGYAQHIVAGRHQIRADEPESFPGGTDTGASPYGLLLASLGACTSITLRLYADRRGWPLTGIKMSLRHDKIHAKDCEGCETKTGKVDYIERVIELEGPLDEEQRAHLLEIADKCPVHKTLHSEVKIATRLA